MLLRNCFQGQFSTTSGQLIFFSSKMNLCKFSPKVCLRKRSNCLTSFWTCQRMKFCKYSKLSYWLFQLSCFTLLFIAATDLLYLSCIKIITSRRRMYFKYMSSIKDRLQILEKRVIYDFQSNSKVEAKSMKNTTSWHFWRIRINFVIIVTSYLRVYKMLIEMLALFAFDE